MTSPGAYILRTDVANDEEARRFDIELLADVLANLHQFALAVPAGARFRFMADVDTFQMFRQRLTTGTGTRWARRGVSWW